MTEALRQLVRERAGDRCEYCRLPAQHVPYLVFHVDHIIARQHTDADADDERRLAWACSGCNYRKGPNLSSVDPVTRNVVRLFDPRRQLWAEHFEFVDGRITGLSPSGRATVRLLTMNSPRLIRIRRELVLQRLW